MVRDPAVNADYGLPTIVVSLVRVSDCTDSQYERRVLTPCGKNVPQIVAPPSGTTLGIGRPVAGCSRCASLITAWR